MGGVLALVIRRTRVANLPTSGVELSSTPRAVLVVSGLVSCSSVVMMLVTQMQLSCRLFELPTIGVLFCCSSLKPDRTIDPHLLLVHRTGLQMKNSWVYV